MKKIILLSFLITSFYQSKAQTLQQLESKRITLPNGWSLTPAGISLPLGDLPLNIAVSPSKKLLAVTNNGQSTQSIQLIDAVNKKILSTVEIAASWYGLKFSADEKYVYASGGNNNCIIKYAIQKALSTGEGLGGAYKLKKKDSIVLGDKWPNKISPAGIETDDAKYLLYAVTKENNSLYTVNLSTKKVVSVLPLGAEAFTCLLSPGKTELYISLWGGDKILVYNTIRKYWLTV